ncbi:adenylate/guanylate cyclase domain-containing protein [Sulfitobacter aestuariivivens]|uniref:Adenylate/guanylate cyclase domain-containing protein n=1 Tax=Sulfitobacter aestuariivivens TaxID=2766981 RepID=A0A927D7R2_9RHOB|nr:adenylate/guanylate cyclase domain-containing protein [Sulfitobacter aestuariivivens]MBD3665961.1 adenylate/guanylate cyclase domain-containing protein [Sulfitobacter aestuariivivens]
MSDPDIELERQLIAILAADVVGYSSLVSKNEDGAICAIGLLWQNIVEPAARGVGGRVVKTMGDGVLIAFSSAVNAVKCALAVQEALAAGDTAFSDGIQFFLRIGVHLGDVVIDGDDILGTGVNMAARLEGLANPGGICVSGAAWDQLGSDLAQDGSAGTLRPLVTSDDRVWQDYRANLIASGLPK